MNSFDCTFRNLRHTFATMAIGNGIDVRTVASYVCVKSSALQQRKGAFSPYWMNALAA